MRVRVVHVEADWDMRIRHKLRIGNRARRLKARECFVAFNRALTIARIIDSELGTHDYYTVQGEVFDLELLQAKIKGGLDVDLEVGRHQRKKAARLAA